MNVQKKMFSLKSKLAEYLSTKECAYEICINSNGDHLKKHALNNIHS